jgi:demethylmenaquinone methyltransferase/2-methoxy-6-polyprenyl-1,4-benzoquinol methylase
MFETIAPSYDRVNAVLSLGVHHRWRKEAVRLSGAAPGMKVLDCATGTGDLALAFKRIVGATGEVVGTDFSPKMLARAPHKAKKQGLEIHFQVADAQKLPYEDDHFDLASISFGIRNVDDPVVCLQEMARVVPPGGKVVVLEFGQPSGPLGALFRLYSTHVMPRLGGWLSGNREAYEYLPRTSATFPAGDRFLELMDKAGAFSQRHAWPQTSGVAYVYVGSVAHSR